MILGNSERKFLEKLKGGEKEMVIFIIEEMLREKQQGKKKQKITKKDLVKDKILMHPDESNDAIAKICDCTERYVQQIKKEINK